MANSTSSRIFVLFQVFLDFSRNHFVSSIRLSIRTLVFGVDATRNDRALRTFITHWDHKVRFLIMRNAIKRHFVFRLDSKRDNHHQPINITTKTKQCTIYRQHPNRATVKGEYSILTGRSVHQCKVTTHLRLTTTKILMFLSFPNVGLTNFADSSVSSIVIVTRPHHVFRSPLSLLMTTCVTTTNNYHDQDQALLRVFLRFVSISTTFDQWSTFSHFVGLTFVRTFGQHQADHYTTTYARPNHRFPHFVKVTGIIVRNFLWFSRNSFAFFGSILLSYRRKITIVNCTRNLEANRVVGNATFLRKLTTTWTVISRNQFGKRQDPFDVDVVSNVVHFSRRFSRMFRLHLVNLRRITRVLRVLRFPYLKPRLSLAITTIIRNGVRSFHSIRRHHIIPTFNLVQSLQFSTTSSTVATNVFRKSTSIRRNQSSSFVIMRDQVTRTWASRFTDPMRGFVQYPVKVASERQQDYRNSIHHYISRRMQWKVHHVSTVFVLTTTLSVLRGHVTYGNLIEGNVANLIRIVRLSPSIVRRFLDRVTTSILVPFRM